MSEEIYEVLKEILPELEAKIRTELASEYETKLQHVQHQCEQELTAIIAQK